MTSVEIFGILSGIFGLSTTPRYIYSMIKGETKPDRLTWWLLAFLNLILTTQSYILGATWSLVLPIVYTLAFFIDAIFSVKYGAGKSELTRLHKFCLLGTFLSLLLWYIFSSALVGLIFAVITDFFAMVPTIYHAYKKPLEEDSLTWILTTIASVFSLLAISVWSFEIYFYPIYLFATNFLVFVLTLKRE